jgi:putative intracellular protease/amidase
VDTLVTEITDLSLFDCLVIMQARGYSGNSHAQLLASPEAIALVSDAAASGMLVAAFCGGARVLAAADVISGLTVTGHPLYQQEYVDAGATYVEGPGPPIVDGNILTSRRGQYYCYRICEVMRRTIDDIRQGAKSR